MSNLYDRLKSCIKWRRVGSTVTCNPPPTDTDIDYLCLVKNLNVFYDECDAAGWVLGGSIPCTKDSGAGPHDNFMSMTLDNYNLIAIEDAEFFKKFMIATHLAKRFNLLNKQDRVALFQAVLYGRGISL